MPRSAPALWNLGHKDVRFMFLDGRVEVSDNFGNGFRTPAWIFLPEGLNSALAAQVLFPMASETEMAGQPEENQDRQSRLRRCELRLAAGHRAYPQDRRLCPDVH
ncbi:hypothetical protein [Breoghania sp.]|uniref:hypothetical protein n=1 Tax=Breoghania sp. TaxID=2065378 RepID=UPI0032046976